MREAIRLGALLAVSLALTGCSFSVGGGSVDQGDLEKVVADKLERLAGQRPDSVDCPDALDAEVDATTRCTLSDGKDTFGLTVTATSVDGGNVGLDIQVDDKPQ